MDQLLVYKVEQRVQPTIKRGCRGTHQELLSSRKRVTRNRHSANRSPVIRTVRESKRERAAAIQATVIAAGITAGIAAGFFTAVPGAAEPEESWTANGLGASIAASAGRGLCGGLD
jgi:hypothetical protein